MSRAQDTDFLQAVKTSADSALHWHVKGEFRGNPAYADGLLFAANAKSGKLEACRATDGMLQWA